MRQQPPCRLVWPNCEFWNLNCNLSVYLKKRLWQAMPISWNAPHCRKGPIFPVGISTDISQSCLIEDGISSWGCFLSLNCKGLCEGNDKVNCSQHYIGSRKFGETFSLPSHLGLTRSSPYRFHTYFPRPGLYIFLWVVCYYRVLSELEEEDLCRNSVKNSSSENVMLGNDGTYASKKRKKPVQKM